jgi:Dolichol-phosphate mannosyltransferase subunit 3 (DPM3)
MLLRYQVFLAYGVALCAIWYCCWIRTKKTSVDSMPLVVFFVNFAPVVFLVILGIYLLIRLVVGILSFEDCPDAAKEIDFQIAEAKAEMKKRKVID